MSPTPATRPSRRSASSEESPVDEVVASVDVAGLANLDRGLVAGQPRPVRLEHDLSAGFEHVYQRAQQRDGVGYATQDAEAQHDVEALAEIADLERVHAPILDRRARRVRDRAQGGAAFEVDGESRVHPFDVLLDGDGDGAPGAATLGEEAVEAVEARTSSTLRPAKRSADSAGSR
jgi:hypothetical protein